MTNKPVSPLSLDSSVFLLEVPDGGRQLDQSSALLAYDGQRNILWPRRASCRSGLPFDCGICNQSFVACISLAVVARTFAIVEPSASALAAEDSLAENTNNGALEFDEESFAAALLQPALLLGWVMLALWGADVVYLACVTAGLASGAGQTPRVLSYVAYTYVAGVILSALKNRFIERLLEQRSSEAAQADLSPSARESPAATAKRLALDMWRRRTKSQEQVTAANKFLLKRGSSILLWVGLGLVCLDAVSLNVGVAVGSLLSFAGVGGLALGLATKDLASNLVGGCLVFVTQPFVEGDVIMSEKLPPSKVAHIGWYQTVVVGDSDEQVVKAHCEALLMFVCTCCCRQS